MTEDPAITVIALLVTGYLLVAVEILIIPGIGAAGIGGALCLIAGCYLAYQEYGALYGSLTVALVLVSATVALWWIPRSPFGRDVVHSADLADARAADNELSPGQKGVADSDLRPAGVARFGELRTSVVTEGEFIAAGADIVVTETHGARIVVEADADADATESA